MRARVCARSTNLVKIAKQHEPHGVVVADNLALPHPKGCFDFAISIAVVHHLSTPVRRVEAVRCILELLRPGEAGGQGKGQALIYVWALEQKNSRRGWDEGHEQDVMVPWVMTAKKEKVPKKQRKKGDEPATETEAEPEKKTEENKPESDKTYLRYYHLYRKGELEQDIAEAGGVVVESGYEKDNWWAIASLSD
jgi:tRNA (uracil-5-)-methyltransferase TRM9